MRLFINQPLAVGNSITLNADTTHRLQKVMRARVGDAVTLFNGKDGEYVGEITSLSKKSATVLLSEHSQVDRESPLKVSLIQGISRGNRMDYTIQKSVELGVSAIIPVATKRSMVKLDEERKDNRMQHWQGVIHHACEQSGRTRVPQLHSPLPIKDIAELPDIDTSLFMDTQGTTRIADIDPPQAHVYLISGPEGGFDDDERQWIRELGVTPIKLGPRILRTETAALAAISVIQQLWGDL
ncbi:MAG: 16S rRNA (uracil(1498)-N(3))-methyltransferase [Pseudomonadota bacterium]